MPTASDAPRQPACKPASRPKPVTLAWLRRAALHYLERYASSSENLRRVLARKVERRLREREEPAGEEEREAAFALVETAVAEALSGGYVDDRAYAEAKVASLRRRGGSRRAIAARLNAAGIDADMAGEALRAHAERETDDDEAPDAERVAAQAFARRRRLGPYRLRERAERRDRDLAAMMRAGFGYAIARETIDGD